MVKLRGNDMQKAHNLKVYPIDKVKELKINGRTKTEKTPVALFWTGSGIEVNIRGSELWIELEVNFETFEPWISVLVNGQQVSRQMLMPGRYWLPLVRSMDSQVVKHIEVIKETPAMPQDDKCYLLVHALKCDGQFLPVKARDYKLEFVGDSITSGEGALGGKQENDWISMWFSHTNTYPYLTSRSLNADYRIVSQSGWGIRSGWDNNIHHNIPECYEQICSLLEGIHNKQLGAKAPYDFKSWQSDAVIINLGTNDSGAFHSPAWLDAKTGKSYKQRTNRDRTYNEEDLFKVEQATYEFLHKVRRNNPNAYIVWCYGMIGQDMMPMLYRAMDQYCRETGDRKCSILQLPNTSEQLQGALGHPGLKAHEQSAKILSEYLKNILVKD